MDIDEILNDMNPCYKLHCVDDTRGLNDTGDFESHVYDDELFDNLISSYDQPIEPNDINLSHRDVTKKVPEYVCLEPSLKAGILEYARCTIESDESVDISQSDEENGSDIQEESSVQLSKAELSLMNYETPKIICQNLKKIKFKEKGRNQHLNHPQTSKPERDSQESLVEKKSRKKMVKNAKKNRRQRKSTNRAMFSAEVSRQKKMRQNNMSGLKLDH
ncbi:hypothetical protein RF11_15202 [Thelohanellus kitauei]|uniref:Protein LTV1 homolog n=1 Tax=Thelohanellus kitauei TaxID=669202 RepID=A0A0C2JTG0_THEKT|nr:hypothetical protein RF11_15202 [Thelohanellus kitauei]